MSRSGSLRCRSTSVNLGKKCGKVDTSLFEKALQLATEVHEGQVDKAGKSYIGHILRVMSRVTTDTEKTVALLHDVVEDSDRTFADLAKLGFPEGIVKVVDCVTRRGGETYSQFIERCGSNAISRAVKLADLEDNMDIRRFEKLGEKDLKRLNKYLRSYRYLSKLRG